METLPGVNLLAEGGENALIYLDYNSTTPIAKEVRDIVAETLEYAWGNASSEHVFGTKARDHLGTARAQVAVLFIQNLFVCYLYTDTLSVG